MNAKQIAAYLQQQGHLIPLDVFAKLHEQGIIMDEFTNSIDGYVDVDELVAVLEDAYDELDI